MSEVPLQVPGWNARRDTEEAVQWAARQLGRVAVEGVSVWPVEPGPVDPSFRALSGRLKFTVRRHKFNKDSPPLEAGGWHVPGEALNVSIGGEVLLSVSPTRAATLSRPV